MSELKDFDVFIAYDSQDKIQVELLVFELRKHELKPWIDLEQVLPGQSFQDEIQVVIPLVRSAVICIGLSGLGRWQVEEVRTWVHQCVERHVPVIPVLLRGVEEFPSQLLFLRERNWVSLSDDEAINRLVSGIIQEKRSLESELSPVKKLEKLYEEKKATESKISILAREIEALETSLRDENDPQRDRLSVWLKDRDHMAKTYGKATLRGFSALKLEIEESKSSEHKKNQFYAEISSYLELIYGALVTKDFSFLDNPRIQPSLSDPDQYRNASSDIYRETLDKIKNKIPPDVTGALRDEAVDYFNYLKSSLPLDD